MQIDWLAFSPVPAFLGGILLGLAAALYVILHGRILGISGIVSGLLSPKDGDIQWRLSLALGLLSAPILASLFFGLHTITVIDADWITIIIAGVLVGFGANYGSGCTSGHGVCGLSRLSPRSLVATVSFMSAGFLIVFVIRHVLGL
ncbi:YeeE/YedE family protein [Polynucleobacter sp. MG-Unter2-18]|uniref:YeeE/YedE family protein n=1 Tax=Polynucleobacter sp. MG-Unter2-18 TaxID=2081052 RepID=UPI001BFD29D1|nr:YeeE/YedE thiosulfate transporter family protein [Polynucleobacter sp. MG-Unter2-18]QWD93661.1 YeeE/YedE family protein [Polynucleobacter sp. MG-Unter2-18]